MDKKPGKSPGTLSPTNSLPSKKPSAPTSPTTTTQQTTPIIAIQKENTTNSQQQKPSVKTTAPLLSPQITEDLEPYVLGEGSKGGGAKSNAVDDKRVFAGTPTSPTSTKPPLPTSNTLKPTTQQQQLAPPTAQSPYTKQQQTLAPPSSTKPQKSTDSDKLSPNVALFGRAPNASPRQTIYDALQQPFPRSKGTKMFDADDSKLSSFTQQLVNYHEQRILQKIEEGSISIGDDAASKRVHGMYQHSASNLDAMDERTSRARSAASSLHVVGKFTTSSIFLRHNSQIYDDPPHTLAFYVNDLGRRPVLYYSFCKYILEKLTPSSATKEAEMTVAINWLAHAYSLYPMRGQTESYFRIFLFMTLRQIEPHIHSAKNLIERMLAHELLHDYLTSITSDIEKWFLKNEASVVEKWVKDVDRISGKTALGKSSIFPEDEFYSSRPFTTNSSDVDDQLELEYDGHVQFWENIWMDTLSATFTPPNPEQVERIFKFFTHKPKRSDAYGHLIKFITSLSHAIQSVHISKEYEKLKHSEKETKKRKNSSVGRSGIDSERFEQEEGRQRLAYLKNEVVWEEQLTGALSRLEWVLLFTIKLVVQCPPAISVLIHFYNAVKEMGEYHVKTSLLLFERFKQLAKVMQKVYKQQLSPSIRKSNDISSEVEERPPLIVSTIPTTEISRKLEDQIRNQKAGENSKIYRLPELDDAIEDYDPRGHKFNLRNVKDKVAFLEGIFVQVDPIAERLVMPSVPQMVELTMEEMLVSVSSGSLLLSETDIVWLGVDKTRLSTGKHEEEEAIRLPFSDVTKFTFGRIYNGQQQQPFQSLPPAVHTSPGAVHPELDGYGVSKFTKTDTDSSAGKSYNPPPGTKVFYMSIVTNNEVYKLYPFFENEIQTIITIFTNLTGLEPFRDVDYIKNILVKRLEFTRRHVLRELLKLSNPWIQHSAELGGIMGSLTSMNQPQRIWDMERLFHSCRLEQEVTKEAINVLKRLWQTSQTEQVKLKILSIADRLLDRVILREGDPNFSVLFKFLKHLEETISPFRNAEALRLVQYLVKRGKTMQIEPLTPLVHNQLPNMFDAWKENSFLMKFFNNYLSFPSPSTNFNVFTKEQQAE